MDKLVSIGVPTFNGELCVRRALDSLTQQTYKNIEIIVSDDASTDNTFQICEFYAKQFPQVSVRQKVHGGYVNNFYAVLRKAKGEYFMWATQDDKWSPECIETLVEVLEKRPECGVALSAFQRFYEDGVVDKYCLMEGDHDFSAARRQNRLAVYKYLLINIRQNFLNHFVLGLFRRELLARFLKRPLTERMSWDTIFAAELALATDFASVRPVLRFSSTRRLSPKGLGDKGEIYIPSLVSQSASWYWKPRFFTHFWTYVFFVSLSRIFVSAIVPIRMKFFVLFPWLSAAWIERGKLLDSLFKDCKLFLRRIFLRL